MVSVEDRSRRMLESALKIQSPFRLDETLCLYSPQDNVDALKHPRIAEWLDFIRNDYEPELPAAGRHVLLLMPCTKTKPYPFSSEHLAINQRLLDEGYRPTGRLCLPQELQARLQPPFEQDVLNLSPLADNRGTVLHRMVISEPMAVVPYEHIAEFRGKASPAVAYDDPGLFENRGNAVSPWRADSTAIRMSPTRWKWGDEERRQYVVMHNEMARILADVVARIGRHYHEMISWVAPGLTHRSFVLARGERAPNGVASSRKVGAKKLALLGANDHLAPELRIDCLPTSDDCKIAIASLSLAASTSILSGQRPSMRAEAPTRPRWRCRSCWMSWSSDWRSIARATWVRRAMPDWPLKAVVSDAVAPAHLAGSCRHQTVIAEANPPDDSDLRVFAREKLFDLALRGHRC